MGCTDSLPVPNAFDEVHKVNPSIPLLGREHGACPSSHSSQQLIVRENLFSWSGNDFKIKTREGAPFGNNLKMQGKVLACRDQMVLLLNGNNVPVAVCLRKFERFGQNFSICSTRPLYPGQSPSDHKYNQYVLYTYAKVERVPFSTEQQVTIGDESSPSYTVHRARGVWPKKRVVERHGHPAALMEGGTWEGNQNSYLLTISPGIDPCLIVCLTAICDEMDEDGN